MIVSHYRPVDRSRDECRFVSADRHTSWTVRWSYRQMRRDGVNAFNARLIVVSLLRAGKFDTAVTPKPVAS